MRDLGTSSASPPAAGMPRRLCRPTARSRLRPTAGHESVGVCRGGTAAGNGRRWRQPSINRFFPLRNQGGKPDAAGGPPACCAPGSGTRRQPTTARQLHQPWTTPGVVPTIHLFDDRNRNQARQAAPSVANPPSGNVQFTLNQYRRRAATCTPRPSKLANGLSARSDSRKMRGTSGA